MSFLYKAWQWLTGAEDEGSNQSESQEQTANDGNVRRPSPEEIRRLRLLKLEQERKEQLQREESERPKTASDATPISSSPSSSPAPQITPKEDIQSNQLVSNTVPADSGVTVASYSDEQCLHDIETLAVEECLGVTIRKQYWKRPLTLGVKDKNIVDVTDTFDISEDDENGGMSKTTAEALMMLLLDRPHEDIMEFLVESHAKLCEEARSLQLFNMWTNRKSVKSCCVNIDHVKELYAKSLLTLTDMVGMFIGVVIVSPDAVSSSRVAPSAARLIDFVLDDSFACGGGVFSPRFKPSYGQPISLLYTLDKCLVIEDLRTITLALTEAVVRRATSAETVDRLNACLMLIVLMSKCKRIAEIMTESPRWLGGAAGNGKALEALTPLGLLFTVSPLSSIPCCAKLAKEFENPLHRNVSLSTVSVKDMVSAADKVAAIVLEEMLGENGTAVTRRMTLKWIQTVIEVNREREKMRFNRMVVSSDGFLSNLSRALVTFAARHVSHNVDELDSCFPLEHQNIILLGDSSFIGFSEEEAKSYCKNRTKKENGPQTDLMNTIFYYASCCFHLGYVRFAQDNEIVRNNASVLQHNLETLRVDAAQDAEARLQAERTEAELAQYVQIYLCQEVHLTDEEYMDYVATFMASYCRWVLSLLSQSSDVDTKFPDSFAVMPTVLLQDLGDFFQISTAHGYCFLPETLNPILELVVRILGCHCHLKAAFLRPKFVEGLDSLMSQEKNAKQRPDVQSMLENNELCRDRLMPALLQMHTDVDQAKGDKVQFRYSILRVGLRVLRIPAFAVSMNAFAAQPEHVEQMQRFLMDLTHDVSKAFNDAVDCLERIHSGDSTAPVAQEARQNMQLLNVRFEFLELFLSSLTADVRSNLTEMVSNALSDILVYAMSNLVGVPSLRLKVQSPESYNFNALQLFRWTARSVVALVDNTVFVECVAKNPQAKEGDMLQHVYRKLRQYRVLDSADDVSRFEQFAQRVGELDTSWLDGDHPDEFVDQISGSLMMDPVILPSGNVIDRTTLERLLVDNNVDPFTRVPMKAEDAKPDKELHDKIAKYIETLKQQQKH